MGFIDLKDYDRELKQLIWWDQKEKENCIIDDYIQLHKTHMKGHSPHRL